MASNFKKDWSRIRTINGYWFVITGCKRNWGGIGHFINRYAKANNKHMKDCNKK